MEHLASLVFSLGSLSVAPFWALMLVAPRGRWTSRIVGSPAIALGPVVLYAWLVLPALATLLPAVARPELPVIAGLLGTARAATVAWMHFLALDLFAGRWIFLDARTRDLSTWLLIPLLLLTLLFAPLGLGGYLAVRALVRAIPSAHPSTPDPTPNRSESIEPSTDSASRSASRLAGGTARTSFSTAARAAARAAARGLGSSHPALAWLTAGALALLAVSLVIQAAQAWAGGEIPREILGAPAWMKPAKFAASIALTAPALAWILGEMRARLDPRRWRWLDRAGVLIAGLAALELAAITVQAARGVPSHFNYATRFDAAVFETMGAAIALLWLAELFITVGTFRMRFPTPARTWAIRLGLVGTLLGGAIGAIMPRPTTAQLESLRARRPTPRIGAHAVGVPDGGAGLPFTRWSTEGGDLRVPHFFGLHALQALPLAAILLERRARRRSGSSRRGDPGSARSIVALGLAWIGITSVTLWQALRGQPLLAPDARTSFALCAVLAAAAAIALGGRLLPHRTRGPIARTIT
jgi:hypothetical protein